ncbi:MAG: dihydroxyacetone kinase subunit DhaL [Paracoccaceae bacterium]
MTTKKLINHPDEIIDELIAGIVSAHPSHVFVSGKTKRAIVAQTGPRDGKVGIVIGGGSGHEPTFAGYVGQGLADAAAIGNIFASPSPAHIVDAANAVERGAGVLFLYGNYAGDVMNFDMAAEQLIDQGLRAESFLVTDDIASAPPERASERRGIAGDFFVFKIAGAAADLGLNFDQVKAAAELANANTRTMGVALSACSMPQTGKANFEIPEGEMEVGMGIHGEPGIERTKIETADQVTDRLLEPILNELECSEHDSVAVLINGLGSTTLLEQYLIHRRVSELLGQRSIKIHNSWVGEYCTSLEMAGVSITLLKLDDDLETWLDHPCNTPALQVGRISRSRTKQVSPTPRSVAAASSANTGAVKRRDLKTGGDVTPEIFRSGLLAVAKEISAQKEYLCELDGVIGDGDHGITMDIGWRALANTLNGSEDNLQTITQMCDVCAKIFLDSVGASVGPLYATGFKSAGKSVGDRLNLDPYTIALWIEGMATGISNRGNAEVGDKTMIDAWRPGAKAALNIASVDGSTSKQVLEAAAAAANAGAENTKRLVARKGRSRTLGERSLGHVDPGAASAAIILNALAKSIPAPSS